MEFVAAAFHSSRGDVGDVFSLASPDHVVATFTHGLAEILLGTGDTHTLVDGVHHLQFPALALDGGAVLPAAHAVGVFLWVFQNGELMGFAEPVGDVPQTMDVVWTEVEHLPVAADSVDHEM